jgi:cytoskeletal protein RodZ
LIVIGAIVLGLIIIGGIVAVVAVNSNKDDPYVQPEPASSNTEDKTDAKTTTPEPTKPTTDETDSTAIDPATVSTIDVTPMELTVSYVKGAGAFEYEVLRTPSGAKYVEFRSAELAGTKCTNDQGAFASILANPDNTESATLTKTTTIDDTKYGLSLASDSCTSNPEALKAYQKSFSDAFSLLKKIN